ncbi:hypothetical protein AgCh_032924 [Apium graveolens]
MPCRINLHWLTGSLEFLKASLRRLRMLKSSGQLTVVLVDWDETNFRLSTKKKINIEITGIASLRFIIMTFISRLALEAQVLVKARSSVIATAIKIQSWQASSSFSLHFLKRLTNNVKFELINLINSVIVYIASELATTGALSSS